VTTCPVDVFRWRDAIASELGPTRACERLLLLTISLHMNKDGIRAWPSQETLSIRTALSLRTVKRRLKSLVEQGWIARQIVRRRGQAWRGTEYAAVVPDGVYRSIPDRPWEIDPTWRRGVTVAPSKPARPTNAVQPMLIHGANDSQGGATNHETGAIGLSGVVPSSGLLTPSPNSSSKSIKNSSIEGQVTIYENEAPKQEPRPQRFGEGPSTEIPEEVMAEIRRLATDGTEPRDIAKQLRPRCSTLSTRSVIGFLSLDQACRPVSDS